MKKYLYDALIAYKNENPVSFHVPGHKNGRAYLRDEDRINFSLDVTEIEGTDNLHNPKDAIYNMQRSAAEFYRVKSTYFLVNGTTCGIQAMILASTMPNDKIIIARNCHKSVYNACVLGDLQPIIAYPEIDKRTNIILGVSPEHIEKLFAENNDIKAVVITSPTYEGIHSDIKSIADIVHKNGAVLLIDEAHGAHLILDHTCGIPAINQGADISVQSTHKSLSSLTQSSLLHVGSDRINEDRLKTWLSTLQSSSPSYLLMSSLEKSIYDMINCGRDKMNELLKNIDDFHNHFEYLSDFILTEGIINKGNLNYSIDPTKLCIFCENADNIERILREKYHIQVEYSTPNNLVCVCSIWNSKDDFIKLQNALDELIKEDILKPYSHLENYELPKSNRAISPRQAFYTQATPTDIKSAIGKICLETIVAYPPGIPIIMSGEIFNDKHYEYIINCKKHNIDILGQRDESLKTIYCSN